MSFGTASAFEGIVGPTVIPYETACYGCYQARAIACRDDPASALRELDSRYDERDDLSGVRENLPFTAGIVGHLLALQAFQFIVGIRPRSVGRVLVVDFLTSATSEHVVLRKPWCSACFSASSERMTSTAERLRRPDRSPGGDRQELRARHQGLERAAATDRVPRDACELRLPEGAAVGADDERQGDDRPGCAARSDRRGARALLRSPAAARGARQWAGRQPRRRSDHSGGARALLRSPVPPTGLPLPTTGGRRAADLGAGKLRRHGRTGLRPGLARLHELRRHRGGGALRAHEHERARGGSRPDVGGSREASTSSSSATPT